MEGWCGDLDHTQLTFSHITIKCMFLSSEMHVCGIHLCMNHAAKFHRMTHFPKLIYEGRSKCFCGSAGGFNGHPVLLFNVTFRKKK